MSEFWSFLRHGNWQALLRDPTENGVLQLFRYGLVGGCAFLIDFGVYCLLTKLGMYYLLSGVFSFVVSFLFNFYVSRTLIFQTAAAKTVPHREFIGVVAVSVIGLGLTELLLYLFTDALGIEYRLSKIIASLLVLIWNYAGRKWFVYRTRKEA